MLYTRKAARSSNCWLDGISSGIKITLSGSAFWQLNLCIGPEEPGNWETGKCHRHQLAISSLVFFFLCFSHSLNSLTYFWKCQNELKLLNYFLYTHIWQRASRESFHLPPSGGFRQTVLVSVNGFGEENTLADHRRSISPWMKSIEIGVFSLGLCNG